MSRNSLELAAPASRVFEILANPCAYSSFVVGAKRIRRYDQAWPNLGSTIHHTFGLGPFLLRDVTTVVAVEPGRSLVLDAGMSLMGASQISFSLDERGDGCALSIEEHPCAGAIAAAWNPALDGLLGLRNAELLRRVRELADGTATPEG